MWYKICAGVLVVCAVIATERLVFMVTVSQMYVDEGYFANCVDPEPIIVIPVHGDIGWGMSDDPSLVSAYDLSNMVDHINQWTDFSGIILDIDSAGGAPVASLRLAEAIKYSDVPVAVTISDMGLSGGYAVASAADRIFVNPISDVGSIGVTASYVDESGANELAGYQYQSLSTGSFKDVGDPARALSEEERTFMMDNLYNAHDYFIAMVAENRGLPLDEVKALADGRWFSGTEAITLGLADEVGDFTEAANYLSALTGGDKPVCFANVY